MKASPTVMVATALAYHGTLRSFSASRRAYTSVSNLRVRSETLSDIELHASNMCMRGDVQQVSVYTCAACPDRFSRLLTHVDDDVEILGLALRPGTASGSVIAKNARMRKPSLTL